MRSALRLEDIRAEKARRRLSDFGRFMWREAEGDTYVHGWHIDAICEHLEAVSRREIRRLVINMPPRHMKSLNVSVFWQPWDWIDYPHKAFMFASYAQMLSDRDGRKAKKVLTSNRYRRHFATNFHLTRVTTRHIENSSNGYRFATSIGGQATGEGAHVIVADDPHNVMDGESETKRRSVLFWWDEVMSSRLNDPKTGCKVIVMQRVHKADLSGHVLEKDLGYEHLCLPAEYEGKVYSTSIGFQDPRTEDGELLWPEHMDRPSLDELKASLGNSYAVAGQLQQRPAPRGGGMFKNAWWEWYDDPPKPEDIVYRIQSWDTAYKKGPSNSWSVGEEWAECRDGRYYLLGLVRDRWEYPDLKRAVQSFYDLSHPHEVLIEDKASGQSLAQELGKGTRIPVRAITVPDGDKAFRAQAVTPLAENRKIVLPRNAPWIQAFVHEVETFPAGAFNDQVDSMTQGLTYLQNNYVSSGQRHWK